MPFLKFDKSSKRLLLIFTMQREYFRKHDRKLTARKFVNFGKDAVGCIQKLG